MAEEAIKSATLTVAGDYAYGLPQRRTACIASCGSLGSMQRPPQTRSPGDVTADIDDDIDGRHPG